MAHMKGYATVGDNGEDMLGTTISKLAAFMCLQTPARAIKEDMKNKTNTNNSRGLGVGVGGGLGVQVKFTRS